MTQSNDGKSWHNPRYDYVGMPAPPIASQPHRDYHRRYQNDNRYVPGRALSTITERSTPRMGEGRTSLGNYSPAGNNYSPASFQSDLEYYTAAQGSEASYGVSPRQQQEQQQPPSPNTQHFSSKRRKYVENN